MKTLRTIFLLAIFTLLAFADSTEIKRPQSDADLGSMSWVTTNCGVSSYQSNSTAGTLGRDADGQATSVTLTKSGSGTGAKETSRTFYSWAAITNTYTALTLNVNSSGIANGDDVAGKACLAYSLDSGVTWTQIRCTTTSWAHTTDTIALSATQDMSTVMVGACMKRASTGAGLLSTASVTVYDIWSSGTLGSAAVGTGSSSGTSVQPVQFN
jgi:hypothetical protein